MGLSRDSKGREDIHWSMCTHAITHGDDGSGCTGDAPLQLPD